MEKRFNRFNHPIKGSWNHKKKKERGDVTNIYKKVRNG